MVPVWPSSSVSPPRAHDLLGAHRAARAGAVLDDDRLASQLAQPLGHLPREHVVAAARCERDDDVQHLARLRTRRAGCQGEQRRHDIAPAQAHAGITVRRDNGLPHGHHSFGKSSASAGSDVSMQRVLCPQPWMTTASWCAL